MSIEIEQKYRTDGHESLAARLAEMGAEAGSPVEQEDTYFNHPSRDFAISNEALRIRRIGGSNAITYKGPKRQGPTKTREEIEIGFTDGPGTFAEMNRMFANLGFQPVATVRKVRTSYHLTRQGRPVEVVLDVAEGLGMFAEVETIAESEDEVSEAQGVVVELARSLGLTALEPRSYLRMTLESRAERNDG